MSEPNEHHEGRVATNRAPIELRVLARLEFKKRRLLEELAEVESLHRQFSREIALKGIPIPWLNHLGR
jgi:hypothetical protein